ncbi:3-hydroxyacyl-CoA dehydrogenase family protein [Sediminibacterium goheungense]|uniref:3-hydroxybutyryl-CoA dehydrogenase n=1 Tax=Sediminibacterium goheungense TaxID=1086393 RepID=A0A4R6IUQ7_9BACT|nr:3-hydroxyacyl-CoA dehydrogenase NAD-binding domain-containing protein [Sediminibacterium goheungense]TDO26350.1 3-hydroxybutyryl-CoA dehydrogenase [Sediminibacterium goheungense]
MNHIKIICVCGAGTMGSGIAQVAAQAGFQTIQFDLNPDMVEKSKQSIETGLTKMVDKGRMTIADKDAIVNRILFTSDIQQCRADLIIEAIIEKKEAKTGLFQSLSVINAPDTILATNTSSISVTEIAVTIPYPERVIGMHFFNPAPLMKLVEIIRTDKNTDLIIEKTLSVTKQMQKTPVLCKDAPGFIVNRVARHYYLEAMRFVEKEQVSIESIDQLMEASGFKMGPFKLMDLIGMDINYGVSNIVWEALDKPVRLTPSPLQRAKVEAGELGRKTGKGFYNYGSSQ